MRLFNRKSQLQRLLDNVNDSLDALSAIKLDAERQRPRQGAEGCPAQGQGPQGRPDRRRPRRSHGGERRHLLAQAPQGGGEGRFVKLASAAVFAAGYVVGARAGRERYAQIVDGRGEGVSATRGVQCPSPPGAVSGARRRSCRWRRLTAGGASPKECSSRRSILARLLGMRLLTTRRDRRARPGRRNRPVTCRS